MKEIKSAVVEKTVTYNLKGTNCNSDRFYQNLTVFTDRILEESGSLMLIADDYCSFVQKNRLEPLRTKEEYLLELIMTGIFWRNYFHKAEKTARLSSIVIKNLYKLRKTNASVKPLADKVRGYLAYELLNKQKNNLIEEFTLASYHRLIAWLSAAGEFNEEVIRLKQWTAFYNTKTDNEIGTILRSTISFSNNFTSIGKQMLGTYTTNVSRFISYEVKKYAHREDYFLAARHENEYFLNMFGAEIMNRNLRKAFVQTNKKAVLLPTCMRTEPARGCGAKSDGLELVCIQCNKECNVGKIAHILDKQEIVPYLIPHSSDFSKFLVKWKDNQQTGLIGVACVLNLLTGGYEMKRLNIASQCVFLDYCGCKKHWDREGVATNLNMNQLFQIITPSNPGKTININSEQVTKLL